jgi:3-deoxy-D-manno-octulosonic-acid transferase
MFSLFYNLCLFLLLFLSLPRLLWQRMVAGKYRGSLLKRLGVSLPAFFPVKGQEVIWIHAVSMGEMRAVIPLFHRIREMRPGAAIVISSTTETGQAEAKRSMQDAAAHFFLPLDFSFVIRRFLNRLQPSLLILSESDFWYHLLKLAKERGTRIALVNGKVSERSCSRFRKVPFLVRRIFSQFDLLCVQSELYRERFVVMGVSSLKLHVTGNLKFDVSAPARETSRLTREQLSIATSDRVLVIGSSHAPEEEWFLTALAPVWKAVPNLKVLLVPRHPERFNVVARLLEERAVPFCRFSAGSNRDVPLILIDVMGVLAQAYQMADLAIVAGTYVSHVGGHNLFEPVLCGTPVLFGPHTHNQSDLKARILEASAGREVLLEKLSETLTWLLGSPDALSKSREACRTLAISVRGATQRTFDLIFTRSQHPDKV